VDAIFVVDLVIGEGLPELEHLIVSYGFSLVTQAMMI
jgi:hypothetical protein